MQRVHVFAVIDYGHLGIYVPDMYIIGRNTPKHGSESKYFFVKPGPRPT